MKRVVLSAVLSATALFSIVVSAANLTFAEVVDGVDQKHTKLNVQEFWNRVKDQEVTWSGDVFDVEGGKSQVRILVTDKSRPLYKGYNIRVVTHDFAKGSSLKKGQQIRFKGVLNSFHSKDAGAVIDISDATVF